MRLLLVGYMSKNESLLPSLVTALAERMPVQCDLLAYGISPDQPLPPQVKDVFDVRYPQKLWRPLRAGFKVLAAWRHLFFSLRGDYDVVNFHYLSASPADLLIYLAFFVRFPRSAFVVTFWGDDLNTLSRRRLPRLIQRVVISRCDAVQVLQKDMRGRFLEFFGPHERLRVARFGLALRMPKTPDEVADRARKFKLQFSIPDGRRAVSGGYCSDPDQNHEFFLQEYLKLSLEQRRVLCVVLPMTYGDPEYRESIRKRIAELPFEPGEVQIIGEYLSSEDVEGLRSATDIQVQCARNDGFSASVREALVCGAVLLAQDGLPYDELRQIGVHFHSFPLRAGELARRLGEVVNEWGDQKNLARGNAAKVREYFGWGSAIHDWETMYRDAMQARGRRVCVELPD